MHFPLRGFFKMISKFTVLFLLVISANSFAQTQSTVFGVVRDAKGGVIPGVNVSVKENKLLGTVTDNDGLFTIYLPASKTFTVRFSFIGYKSESRTINTTSPKTELFITLKDSTYIGPGINVHQYNPGMVKVDIGAIDAFPNPGGGIEGLLPSIGLGVHGMGGELSSAYSVRGGNFDENLVFVNDFEVYRPFLVRSGQQEGLSFVNTDMVRSVAFSSGGFDAKYGDKLSSVLDVEYRRPRPIDNKRLFGSVGLSFLGGSAHLEGVSKNANFAWSIGTRYKTSQYLLNSLETKGEYNPSFTDVQTFLTWDLSPAISLEYIGNYARNKFSFRPESQVTTFGVVNNVIQLEIFFDGSERDEYESLMNAFAVIHKPNDHLTLKYMTSYYNTREQETFDIIGEYWLGLVESNLGEDEFGSVKYGLGSGTTHDWARNDLNAIIWNVAHKGYREKENNYLQWGLDFQYEDIQDHLNEWTRLDSAGYSLPFSKDSLVTIFSVLKSDQALQSHRVRGYFQNTKDLDNGLSITAGGRFNYWSYTHEVYLASRFQFAYAPEKWEHKTFFRTAFGLYNQPPFYRELRDLDGIIHNDVKSQKSIHFLTGMDLSFKSWGRDFKFVTEAYFKYMYDLIPYELDNVLIRYYAENSAVGYAAGIDFRLYGEFVKDAESWISMSVMTVREDIKDDVIYNYYDSTGAQIYEPLGNEIPADIDTVHPGFIPKPTDQRVNFAMYFQDYLPNNENFKMHLNLVFGTGLPFGPPDHDRSRDTLRIPPYRRVDIGFSALLFNNKDHSYTHKNIFRNFESVWTTLEVFNLLGINNTISYLWIRDNVNNVYAVPQHLTSRRINLRLIVKF